MVEKLLIITFFIQAILSLFSIILCIYEYKHNHKDFGTGSIFVLLFILESFFPIAGAAISVALCIDSINHIRSNPKSNIH